MTETYNGSWSPVNGDVKERVQDAYHRYPTGKQTEASNEQAVGTYQYQAAVGQAAAPDTGVG